MGTSDEVIKEHQVLQDRYEIREILGQGGMAQVYRGTDRVLNRTVAVKVLPAWLADDPSYVARFRREAQAAAALGHPNVVGIFDTGSDDGVHYIVMEYVEGRTLEDLLASDGRQAPRRATEIAAHVATALSVAHGGGLVHRDVKPGNIMITPSGEVKVMDFGISRVVSSETITQTGTVFGTATYLSPEQARGDPVDERSDIYSLGVVLYEMLSGRPPFSGDSAMAVAYKHVSEDPEPPSSVDHTIPGDIEACVLRALAKAPEQRYQTAEDMRADLERAANGGAPGVTAVAAGAATAGGDSTGPATGTTERIPRQRTDVMQASPRGPRPVPPGRSWVAPLVAGGLILLAILFLVLVLGGRDDPLADRPGRQGNQTEGTTPPADQEAPPDEEAPPEEPEEADPPVQGDDLTAEVGQLERTLEEGGVAGEISRRAFDDIVRETRKALDQFERGDGAGAIETLGKLRDHVGNLLEQGEITSANRAVAIVQALDRIVGIMESISPPEDGPPGQGPDRGPPDEDDDDDDDD